MRRFLFTLAFVGLVLLAFNPQFVVKLQNSLGLISKTENLPDPADVTHEEKMEPDEIVRPEIITEPVDIIENIEPAEIEPNKIETPEVTPPPASATVRETPNRPSVMPSFPRTTKPDPENLPRIDGFEDIAKNDDWIGDTPCGKDVFAAPLSLPGLEPREDGQLLIEAMTTNNGQKIINERTFLYKSPSGATLRLVEPVVHYYQVSGLNFREAHKDIFDRKPLKSSKVYRTQSTDTTATRKTTTLANIASPTSLSYMLYGSGDQYRITTEDVILTSGYLVTLPRWANYEMASNTDKMKWDDLLCSAAHHELGHLRIRLDILAETLEGYNNFPVGKSKEDLKQLAEAYQLEVNEHIQDRQDAYHIYNGGGIRRGMIELPYAKLPFPWLENVVPEE